MGINNLTKTEIADLLSASIRTISTWQKEGMPKNDDGTFDGPAVIRWFSVRLEDKISGKGVMLDVEGRRATNRWREARADREELELAKAKGLLIASDDVYKEWAERTAVMCHSLELLADRLPPVLIGRNRIEMFEPIQEEIWQLRQGLYREGKYTPPPEGQPWPNDDGKRPELWMEKQAREEKERCQNQKSSGRKKTVKTGFRKAKRKSVRGNGSVED